MVAFLTIVHVFVCIFLVIVVLLQHGKGADVGAAFGGASQTVFGPRGAATVLSKITVFAAVTFMVTSLALAYLSSSAGSKSLLSDEAEPKATPAAAATPAGTPAAPAAVPTAPAK